MRVDARTLLPLREFWFGVCHAGQEAGFKPDEHLLGECCNMGYARGKCSRFPEGPGPDAVRFTVVSDSNEMVLVSFAIERDHLPHGQGVVEYSRTAQKFLVGHPDRFIEQQARAYLESYLRRTALT